MRPGDYPLTLYRGDTYVWEFRCYTSTSPSPPPADLTGATAKAEIRNTPGGTLLTSLNCVITLPNIITVKMKTANWTGLNVRTAAWDLQVTYTDPDASVVTILAGAVTITPDVTDSVPLSALSGLEGPSLRKLVTSNVG